MSVLIFLISMFVVMVVVVMFIIAYLNILRQTKQLDELISISKEIGRIIRNDSQSRNNQ